MMKRHNTLRFLITLGMLLALALPTAAVLADGTETLGEPSIPIENGSGHVAAGTGLISQPGEININVPVAAAEQIKQVLLYWEGHAPCDNAPFGVGAATCLVAPDTSAGQNITVDGAAIRGQLIGGPTFFYQLPPPQYSLSYRADITEHLLVGPGANTLDVSGVSFDIDNPTHGFQGGFANGASVVVIYDDGTVADIGIRDGNDNAFINFGSPLDTTVPQTFSFAAESTDRIADLSLLVGSVKSPEFPPGGPRSTRIVVMINGVEQYFDNVLSSADGPTWDTLTLPITIPAGASSLTAQILSVDALNTGNLPASLSWVAAFLSVPVTPAAQSAVFLVIDEDSIDNGIRFHENPQIGQQNIFPGTTRQFSDKEVNDDIAKYGQRSVLRYFQANPGKIIALMTGQTGDEGWFAPTQIPTRWGSTQPEGLSNFIAGTVKQDRLDKIPGVRPLRAMGLKELEGRTICAVVYDSDISINYDSKQPFTDGNLQGATLGIVAFTVLENGVNRMHQFSSSTLPEAQIRIEDAASVCSSPLELFDAPIPKSSSEPNDIDPFNPPSKGYRNR